MDIKYERKKKLGLIVLILMFQKEVADRIISNFNTKRLWKINNFS